MEDLQRDPAWIAELSLVAVVPGAVDEVVGRVCCTRAELLPAGHAVLGLGPLGVREKYQAAAWAEP
ncbi:hypothetical protein [Pseudonocardia nigra]|uniref:hypothetical protein n=1 Tax=Pseudonocardia nigra TaxID=1921578 RepID=UPI001FE54BC6|nr:hypothetical protein [Pseudonocardia nigra]